MFYKSTILLIVLSFTACKSFVKQEERKDDTDIAGLPTEPLKINTRQVAQHMLDGQFVKVTNSFDETLRLQLTPEKLEILWKQYTKDAGNFKFLHGDYIDTIDGLTTVTLYAEFYNKRIIIRSFYNSDNEITLFTFNNK